MAFEIRIKPLVLFDLEDLITQTESEKKGNGKQLYQNFLSALSDIQNLGKQTLNTAYEDVQKFTIKDGLCSLFYMITGNTILIMGIA